MNILKYWKISPVFLSLLVFFLLILFYSPVFAPNFGYLNDYTAFVPHSYGFPESPGVAYIGRPLQAIIEIIQFRFLGDMTSLQLMRVFIVLMIASVGILFFSYLQKNININIYTAALLSLLVFTLPSMAINSFYIVQSGQGIVPLFFIFVSFHLLQIRKSSNKNQSLILISVFFLIILSLLTYQPAAFFFLTLTFIKFIFGTKDSNQAKLTDIFAEITIFFSACIAYFLFIKFIFKPLMFGDLIEVSDAYSFAFSSDIISKITKIKDLYAFDLSAWFPPLEYYFLIPLGLGFVLVVTWASLRTPYLSHLRNSTKIILGISLSALIPIILIAPIFVIQGDYPILYRVSFPSMAAIIPVAVVYVIDRAILLRNRNIVFTVLLVFSPFIFLAEKASYDRVRIQVNRLTMEYKHVFNWFVVEYANNHNHLNGLKTIRIPPFMSPPDPLNLLYRDYGYTSVDSSPEGMVRSVIQSIDAENRHYQENNSMDGFRISYDPSGPRYEADISEGIVFSREGYPSFISNYKGISSRESWGRWTDSEDVVIEFAQSLPRQFILTIQTGASDYVIGKPVKIIIGDAQLDTTFNSHESTEVAFNVVTNGHARSIALHFPTLASASASASSTDSRRLGLALIKIKIAPKNLLHAQNSLIQLIPPPAVSTKFPVDLFHEKSGGLEVEGLSGLESNTKESWRWATGPATSIKFIVDPALPEQARQLVLKLVLKNGVPIIDQTMSIRLNGQEIRQFSAKEINAQPQLVADVSLLAKKGNNVLEFVYKDWHHKKQNSGSGDPRKLAVVFMHLSLQGRSPMNNSAKAQR